MARIDIEEKGNSGEPEAANSRSGNSKWYIIALIVIIGIIVAWIALSDNNRADVEIPPEPVVLKDRTGTNHIM